MKRILFGILILTSSFVVSSNSQETIKYGIKLALTSSNQKFEYRDLSSIDLKRRIGFNAGIFIENVIESYYSIRGQLEYSQRGMGIELVRTTVNSPEGTDKYIDYHRVDYLSLPILIKISYPTKSVQPFLIVGPRIDYLIGYNSIGFQPVYDHLKTVVIGSSIGVGIESTTLLQSDLMLELRYNFDHTDAYNTELLNVRNNSFDLWLGVCF
jgi:hypothetical protein